MLFSCYSYYLAESIKLTTQIYCMLYLKCRSNRLNVVSDILYYNCNTILYTTVIEVIVVAGLIGISAVIVLLFCSTKNRAAAQQKIFTKCLSSVRY
uniref:Uncharacterized protein n=1 Tax=Anguilla anguilla TaxID=7936 RepID=A0A0E9X4U8_ANGAN